MNKNIAIRAENISKQYRLGEVGTGTISHDLNRFWAKMRGKEDPFLKIGESNDRSQKGGSEYVWSLKDINFEIEKGDAVGIIGRNGAGKSTLLKLLSRVTKPTTGHFDVDGRIASLLEVGTGFNPEMTGRENIFLNGAILGMRKHEIKKKLDEIVDFSGVERYIDTPVKRYSSGMYVRLAFAVAAHLESEILIVDEVLAVGDAEFQKKCLGKMGDVSKGEGRTVLFVSHNMGAVQTLCNKGILLEKGNLISANAIDAIVNNYLLTNQSTLLNHVPNYDSDLDIISLKYYNEFKDSIDVILSGSFLEIEVEYFNKTNQEISISIGFYDFHDFSLVLCNSSLQNNFFNKRGTNKASLIIKKFPLLKGNYYLNIELLSSKGIRKHIVKVADLTVEAGDYYGTGKVPQWNKGVLIDFNWIENE